MRTPAVAALLVTATACFTTGKDTAGETGSSTDRDIADYEALKDELNAYREEFLSPGATDLRAAGDRVFWLTWPEWDPHLNSMDATTGAWSECGTIAGSGDAPSWREERDYVGWAELYTGVYHVHDPASCDEVATYETPESSGSGVKWWAFDLERSDLVIVTQTSPHEVQRWSGGAPVTLGTLEGAGMSVGELWDIGVDGDRMMVVESGRIWELDLGEWTARPIGNDSQALGTISYSDRGVMYVAGGLHWWDRASGTTTNVSEVLETSDYVPNPTYTTSHHFAGDYATVHDDLIIYHAQRGIFAYELDTGDIFPILLDERDNSLLYRIPVVANDILFVTSVESESGAVGFEGRTWYVDNPVLSR